MMVDKGCKSCREWQEHFYWKHMDMSKISFFKLMTGDFHKGISIPEKFLRNFKVPEEVELKVMGGEKWRIRVKKHGSVLYLSSGWANFTKAQDLQENDLLIFTCNGQSFFDVLIFEESGCIKVSSVFGPSMSRHFKDLAARHTVHYSLSDSDDTGPPLAGRHIEHYSLSDSDDTGRPSSGSDPDSPNSMSCFDNHEATEEEESDDTDADSKYYYSKIADRLADEEKREILRLAPTRSENPVFVTVLQKHHFRRTNNPLTIPSGFAADHLEARSHDIIVLRRPNRKEKWVLKYYRYTPNRGYIQNLPLFNFLHENKLRQGDICVFELMKGVRRVVMTVHVIRKKADGRLVLLA